MAEDKPICDRVRDLVERHAPFWQSYYQAADEEDAFLDGERYEQDEDFNNRDRRLIQIRGRETEDTIRHWVAETTQRPMNLQARPIDRMGDPQTGEVMASLVEYELRRVDKDFQGEIHKATIAALEHRAGIVWMDWHPDFGSWGEMFFGEEDFRNFMWDPAYSPHHPLNGWLNRTKRIDVDEAREMYGAPWLEPDRMAANQKTGRADRALIRGGMGPQTIYDDDKVTLWQCWYKNDKSKAYRDKKDGKDRLLEPGDRYMSCAGECGYRSPRESDLNQELPEEVEQGCPTCGGNLERIDSLGEQETIYAYSRGRRLVIMAPHQTKDNEPLFNGKWPVPRARSYPGCFIFAQVRSGGRPMGGSQVSWAWDQQVASDQLATMAVQRVFEHTNIYVWPLTGLQDRDGRRYERRDDQGNNAFRDDSSTVMRPNPVDVYPGMGLDPNFGVVYGTVQTKLTQYSGNTDFGFTEDSSKDIAAATIQQLTQQKNLPIAEFSKRRSRAISQFCGVVGDYITATYTPARLARVNIEGTDLVLPVWGQDLPGFDFEIEDAPEFTGTEKWRVEALKMLQQVWAETQSIEMVELFAIEMHFPPSTVTRFKKAIEAMQLRAEEQAAAQQEQQAMMEDEAAQDLEAGLDVPGMPPIAPEMGTDGEGAVPSPMQ